MDASQHISFSWTKPALNVVVMLPPSASYEPLAPENSSNEDIEKPISGWPNQPGPLKNGGAAYFVRILSDVIAVAATCPFLVLGAYAASRKGKPVEEKEWKTIQESMKVVSSVCHLKSLRIYCMAG